MSFITALMHAALSCAAPADKRNVRSSFRGQIDESKSARTIRPRSYSCARASSVYSDGISEAVGRHAFFGAFDSSLYASSANARSIMSTSNARCVFCASSIAREKSIQNYFPKRLSPNRDSSWPLAPSFAVKRSYPFSFSCRLSAASQYRKSASKQLHSPKSEPCAGQAL